ncbi:MAG: peptidyl-prolyl cis-trans isomerase B (cyclophilin B) [Alpinimonas sp.]|jgi:peptidyl-prolyl cis-trans isomerase B (cyclophilin B)
MKYRLLRFEVIYVKKGTPVVVVKKDARESRVVRDRLRAFDARQALHARLLGRRKKDNLTFSIAAAIIVALAIGSQVAFATTHQPAAMASAVPTAAPTGNAAVPDPSISQARVWTGSITINDIVLNVELDGAAAPQAVASTISLATSGFYNNTTCHRLTTEGIWVLQCGDPQGDGTGGPGYSYGPIENAPAGDFYPAGTLAMARVGGDASSIGSQFFIVYQDSTIPSDAAGGYTVIGQITSGLDALVTEIVTPGTVGGTSDGQPLVPTSITSFFLQ